MFTMFDSNKAVCVAPWTGFFARRIDGNMEILLPTPTSVVNRSVAEQTRQWLALGPTPGLGPTRARPLAEHFGNVAAVFRASLTELEASGLLAVSAQSLATGKSMERAQEEMGKAKAAGGQVLTLDDPAYPPHLRQIYDPPLVLYVCGDENVLSQPGNAVVGTRHPTPYGTGMAERLSIDLAAHGRYLQRHVDRRPGCRGSRIQWNAHPSTVGSRTES